jgi:hypothetical protein
MNTEITEENLPVPIAKPRKKREMTPELLEKLALARQRATELRNAARETKSKLPDNIPEKEKTKVAAYLTTRKAIKEKIKQEIVEELEQAPIKKAVPSTEHEVDSKGFMLPKGSTEPPPPLPTAPVDIPKKKKVPEPESDSDDEYTTIKVPKKKIIKWKNYAEKKPEPPPEPTPAKKPINYQTQHLINLAMGGYKF